MSLSHTSNVAAQACVRWLTWMPTPRMTAIATLMGLTVITGKLKEHGLLDQMVELVCYRNPSPQALLFRTCATVALLAALFTNDAAVLVLTEPILLSAASMGAPQEPFALALASSANIGSALTLIGNPQNVLIATASGMPFSRFILKVAPGWAAALVFNSLALALFYSLALRRTPSALQAHGERGQQQELEGIGCNTHSCTRATSGPADLLLNGRQVQAAEEKGANDVPPPLPSVRTPARGSFETLLLVTVVVGLVGGVMIPGSSIAWVVLCSMAVITLGEAWTNGRKQQAGGGQADAIAILRHIDAPLLMLFGGLFVTLGGARMVRLPQKLEQLASGMHWQIEPEFSSAINVVMYSSFVVLLSNLCSNVPCVMLLIDPLLNLGHDDPNRELGFVILSFAATVAGNLTLIGSICNLIVAEKAHGAGYQLTFGNHLVFSLPSTLIYTIGGSLLIWTAW